jgi:hypothetical protein
MSFAFARQASACRPDQLTGLSYPMKKTLSSLAIYSG